MERRIDLNTNQRRAVVVLAVLGFLLVTGIIYLDKRAAYTANLDQRTFNLALVGTIESLAPALLDSHPEKVLAAAMYEGLVYYDEESKSIKPLLASDWRYSSDGKSLTLNLKRKISFHNGKRIEAQDVKKAWENSFSTTKEKGTGLGLAVCYSIVERHGAQLEVETGQDGTVFYIKFPLPPPTADNSNYE
jgi:ABC-type transport system substrate-binding protein